MLEADYLSDAEFDAIDQMMRQTEARLNQIPDIEDAPAHLHAVRSCPRPRVACTWEIGSQLHLGDRIPTGQLPSPQAPMQMRINQLRGRKGVLWVTDLCSVEWCGLQSQYQVGCFNVHAQSSPCMHYSE